MKEARRRWDRFLAHAVLAHGLLHLHAAFAGDVGLERKLAAGRLLLGALDLVAVLGDGSLAPAFLLLAAAEVASAAWIRAILPTTIHSTRLE